MSYTELSCESRKARKTYSCEWCGEGVLPGELYNRRVYVCYGDFHSEAMHEECFKAMNEMNYVELEDGWAFGAFKRGSTEEG
jgi:methionyl-tRNA synthetase